ncbi:MAG TPA: four helix bundle protein [Pyrinomonadaceae bacterium]
MNRPPAKNFQDLIVWQKAHEFVLSVYRLTRTFLARDLEYGYDQQMAQLEEVSKLLDRYCAAILQ